MRLIAVIGLVATGFELAACAQAVNSAAGRTRMKITLSLGRTELVVGESTSVAISLTNTSNAPISVADPDNPGRNPRLRLYNPSTKQTTTLGMNDLEEQTSHEFVPASPESLVPLAPRQQKQYPGDLLRWVGTLAPGQYELSALNQDLQSPVASEVVKLTVAPLDLAGASTVGSHSGYSPFRYVVWSSRTSKGSAVVLTCFTFDEHGHPKMTFSTRVADLDYAATPFGSVTPNKQPYPAQWITWLHGEALASLYVKQGQSEGAPRVHPLGGSPGSKVVPPAILDLTGNDGSKPGRGVVPVWTGGSQLTWHVLEPDGSMSAGTSISMGAGDLTWGRAVALSTGERRVYVAIERQGGTDLEWARWGGQSATRIAHLPGQVIGGGLTLNPQDAVYGAAVARDGVTLSVHAWQADASGITRESQGFSLTTGGKLSVDRAVIVPSPAGKLCIVVRTTGKQWLRAGARGELSPLPATLSGFGGPIDAFWLNEVSPMILMAGAQTGITYQPLP